MAEVDRQQHPPAGLASKAGETGQIGFGDRAPCPTGRGALARPRDRVRAYPSKAQRRLTEGPKQLRDVAALRVCGDPRDRGGLERESQKVGGNCGSRMARVDIY